MEIICQEIIHFTTKEEALYVLGELEKREEITLNDGQASLTKWFTERGIEWYSRLSSDEEGIILVGEKYIEKESQGVKAFLGSLSNKNCNEYDFKSEFESCSDTFKLEYCTYSEASSWEDSSTIDTGFNYDVYDAEDNLVFTIRSPKELEILLRTVMKDHVSYYSYVNAKKVTINEDHDIDYYDQIFSF
jgi:hypothetical protein